MFLIFFYILKKLFGPATCMSIIRQHLLDLKVSLSFLVRPDKSLSYRHKEKDLHSAPPQPII
jgi:hypothetical protein